MTRNQNFTYEIQYTKAADKFFRTHEDVREEYKSAIKELLVGEHPEKVESDFWDKLGPKIPLGRCGEAEDIGRAIAFLASDRAAYITGITLRVDGGLVLPGMPEDPSLPGNGWK